MLLETICTTATAAYLNLVCGRTYTNHPPFQPFLLYSTFLILEQISGPAEHKHTVQMSMLDISPVYYTRLSIPSPPPTTPNPPLSWHPNIWCSLSVHIGSDGTLSGLISSPPNGLLKLDHDGKTQSSCESGICSSDCKYRTKHSNSTPCACRKAEHTRE